ncbi:MAG TPA: hypothetical protein VIC55_06525 [Gemmatimonadaceae bacterium]
MKSRTSTIVAALVAGAASITLAGAADAQAWHYPAFQPPTISTREFTFAVAGGGDYGTAGLAQWREGIGPDTHLAFDVGFDSPSGNSTLFMLGGAIGQRLMRSTQQTPLDLILTGGLYGAFSSDLSYIRVPIGVSVGHRFPLQGGMAITPYVAPRLSVDACVSDCGGTGTNVNVDFDIGADWELNPVLSLRGALTVGKVGALPSKTGFGIGLAFRPEASSARR